jgi:hypothetical protein
MRSRFALAPVSSRSRFALALAVVACLALAVAVPVAIARRRAAERAEIERSIDGAWGQEIDHEHPDWALRYEFEQAALRGPKADVEGALNDEGLVMAVKRMPAGQVITFQSAVQVSTGIVEHPPSNFGVIWRNDDGSLHAFNCRVRDHAEARALALKDAR